MWSWKLRNLNAEGPFERSLHITGNFTLVQQMLRITFLDEFGYLDLKPEQSNTLFKLMEERYHRHSTIVTTNLDYGEWNNFLGNKSMVQALLSRLRHYCNTVRIDGPSLREPQA